MTFIIQEKLQLLLLEICIGLVIRQFVTLNSYSSSRYFSFLIMIFIMLILNK